MHVDFNIDSTWCLQQLHQDGLITQRDLDLVRTTPRRTEQQSWHALQWIAHFKLCNLEHKSTLNLNDLCLWLAKKSGLALYTLDPLKLDIAALTQIMSQEFALKNHILAVEIQQDQVWIATTQPFNQQWIPQLAMSLKPKNISVVLLDPETMQRYQSEFYSINQATYAAKKQYDRHQFAEPAIIQVESELDEQHIVQLVDWLLQFAFEQRASDIHLEPRQIQGQVRFRIDGLLHCVHRMPMTTFNAVVARLKILAQLNVAERRRPQDGRLAMQTSHKEQRELRISTLPTAFGEKMVLRIFDPMLLLRDLSQLGFSANLLATWQQLIQARNGMILVTGPTGSGKTTTLYSTLKQCATEQFNVCSIEDPIEMLEPSFNQMQINPKIDLGFAEAIRALMRQDPDIIMVGEIRDQRTAQMAIQAALTGHLVFSTLHTQDAVSSLIRLQDLGIQPFLIAATLLGILAQRLVRRLCPYCKQLALVDAIKWQHLVADYHYVQPEQLYRARGCPHCRETGFVGRIALYEFLPITTALKQQIIQGNQHLHIREAVYKAGILPLRIAAAEQILQGETSLDEVFTVLPWG
ncbi:GspE/PulE family protein [Acinetobacter rudis]|uniref:General secretion pathway protein E n=1 Tax=Acinetobacter rudis CIP 110305 TaxID=421052 RepID=S3NAT9_9GAMM|nr:GspE/PulE family protein [Acinetobacter rudis]EPF71484.1 general secretion pathway protein E [Acinetobacter rudis CIP 110305]